MAKCPLCENEVEKPYKTWKIENKRTGVTIEMGLYACSNCGNKFRKGKQID